MRVNDYSKAVSALISMGTPVNDVLAGLKKTLIAHHHERMYAKILRHLESSITRAHRIHETRVILARKEDSEAFDSRIRTSVAEIEANEPIMYIINKNIIGGYRVEGNGKSLDYTHKSQLRTLYKSIIESL